MFYSVSHLKTSASHRKLKGGVEYQLFTESKDDTHIFFSSLSVVVIYSARKILNLWWKMDLKEH